MSKFPKEVKNEYLNLIKKVNNNCKNLSNRALLMYFYYKARMMESEFSFVPKKLIKY